MTKSIENTCRAAIAAYGEQHQKQKAIEEMGELASALVRYADGRCEAKDVITEIADVMITVSQMAIIFGEDEVMAEVDEKIDRLAGRLAENWLSDFEQTISDGSLVLNREATLQYVASSIKEGYV